MANNFKSTEVTLTNASETNIVTATSNNQIIIKSSEDINNQPLKISFSKDKVLFFDKNKNRIR